MQKIKTLLLTLKTKLKWNKTKTLWTIIVVEFIIILLLITQRGYKTEPTITDVSFQDSLIKKNKELEKRIFNQLQDLNKKNESYNKNIDRLLDSFTLRENKIKKERDLINEKVRTIYTYNNAQLARAYSNFK